MEIFQLILILQLFLVTVIKGQCFGNGTCVCHCVDCSEKCTTCLPGWGGSKDYNCQRRNVLYRAAAGDDKDDKNKLLDEDFSTSLENKDYKPFLRVQLNKSITIDKLDITLLLERGVNYTVYIKDMAYVRTMDVICNKLDQSNNTGKRTVSITCYKPLSGKYLEIVSSEKTRVKIFEIRYFECTNGTFGENCSSACATGSGIDCNINAVDCVSQKGFFGKFCNQTCSESCDESGCNLLTGKCLSCKNGYFGPLCEKNCSFGCQRSCGKVSGNCTCKPGFFTSNCSKQCPINCNRKVCKQSEGKCLVCKDGYYGDFCEHTCIGNCEQGCVRSTGICGSCTKGFYSHFCNTLCSENCMGDTCSRDGSCYQCKPGYKGEQCYENCPEHCTQCKQYEYGCSQCENGWFGVRCAEKCPAECGGNGSCEMKSAKCHVCAVGYFGSQCDQKCSPYCDLNAVCDIDTGVCERCIAGRHGSHCESQCSQNCLNFTCLSNQTCSQGCKDGWFGDRCNQECNAAISNCAQCSFMDSDTPVCHKCAGSRFLKGSQCVKCPENCSSCESEKHCTVCSNDVSYGKTCNIPCSGDCINKMCDMTGNCLYGCNNSKYGMECDKDCAEGCRLCYDVLSCLICEDGWVGSPCQQCPKQCGACFDNLTCTTCQAGWTNLNANCTVGEDCIRNPALCG
ncbi:multiple epidermal growth factor-like domains protein 11 isoform X1 [Ostrea edulis]|uniref:multiple epidermal growth factor-like domains protein 11 isoform X1 n=2 Tax=Ostrea edulis TaxID=37623 RepID=UPI0024AFFB83|nr:multiple epidermal growth factor-like domains protein 11 isoform X1 [Ostrea edulis]XP_056012420.1 multiple epidermal growth factor-like domains protein 11 isoform X1 [Ostrea edulis]XP_056012421.1 multiple epidermal growth factor-like domains protein 11 isoform X1 [Ostrea edulis]